MISDKQVTAEELYAAIHGKCVAVDDFSAALLRAAEDFGAALLRERRLARDLHFWKERAEGYRDALAELAGSIPMDDYMKMVGSDHPLAQALGQANLVLQEGPQ